jgi:hypothetical protein
MLHNGNKIFGDPISEESIKLITQYLVKSHKDKDENSLFVRFNQLLNRVQEQEISHQATWNSYLNSLDKSKTSDTIITYEK